MTFEELQINLNLVFDKEDKYKILDAAASRCKEGYFFVDDDGGECYLLDENGNLDDIKKIKILSEEHIKKNIKKIKIPNSVMSIGNFAFSNCSNLTSMTLPNSIKSISLGAFCDCDSLMSVMIPDSVMSINNGAFEWCNGLISVTIPNSVMSIGFDTFWSCKNLKELVFKRKTLDEVKSMKNYPFGIKDWSIIKVE